MDFIGSYSISENYLYNLHVMENKRNRGYGLKMLEHAKTEKKDLILDIDPENEIAILCYKKCGFMYKKRCMIITIHVGDQRFQSPKKQTDMYGKRRLSFRTVATPHARRAVLKLNELKMAEKIFCPLLELV